MDAPGFVHLRVHTEYSISDSIVRIDALVEAALADQQPAVAVTDLGNLFGWVKFYKAARAKGIQPICGADLWLSNELDRDRPFDCWSWWKINRATYRYVGCCRAHGSKMSIAAAAKSKNPGSLKKTPKAVATAKVLLPYRAARKAK
jgi:DNA polymerase III alpha subunit